MEEETNKENVADSALLIVSTSQQSQKSNPIDDIQDDHLKTGHLILSQFPKKQNGISKLKVEQIPRLLMKSQFSFFLRGEIFLDLQFDEHQSISNLNHYKGIKSVRILKNHGILFANLTSNKVEYDTIDQALSMLKFYKNQDVQEIGQKLKEYEVEMYRDMDVKKFIYSLIQANPFMKSLVTSAYTQFQEFREFKLKNLPADRYFMFEDYSFDYDQMLYFMISIGMNDSYAKLIGSDLESVQDIYLRKGIIEFFEANSRWKIFNEFMKSTSFYPFSQSYIIQGHINLITLDEIQIEAPYTATFYACPSNQIFSSFIHPSYYEFLFDSGFSVIEIHLNEFHIQKINSIRQTYTQSQTDSFNEIFQPHILQPQSFSQQSNTIISHLKTDIPFQIQSQLFLEKFYPKIPDSSQQACPQDINPSKTCKFKFI